MERIKRLDAEVRTFRARSEQATEKPDRVSSRLNDLEVRVGQLSYEMQTQKADIAQVKDTTRLAPIESPESQIRSGAGRQRLKRAKPDYFALQLFPAEAPHGQENTPTPSGRDD